MSTLLRVLILGLAFFSIVHESFAYSIVRERQYLGRTSMTVTPSRVYQYSGLSSGVSCNFSFVSVGIGMLGNGVTVMIDSPDASLTNCIKQNSWLPYFQRFGNSVSVSTDYTTRGVQIVVTSSDAQTISDIQNTQWGRIIRSAPSTASQNQNTVIYYDNNYPYNGNNYYNNFPQNTYQPYTYNPSYYTPSYPTWSVPTTPVRNYRAGSSVFANYSQISRGIAYINNGVQMTFTSPDYRTMLYLQSFYFTGFFSEFSGVSVNLVNISGGIQVTVTSGSTSTIDEIQKIGYALVYR